MIALRARTIGTKAAIAEREAISKMKKVMIRVGSSSPSSELLTYWPKSALMRRLLKA